MQTIPTYTITVPANDIPQGKRRQRCAVTRTIDVRMETPYDVVLVTFKTSRTIIADKRTWYHRSKGFCDIVQYKNDSIVMSLSYGGSMFLFAGDQGLFCKFEHGTLMATQMRSKVSNWVKYQKMLYRCEQAAMNMDMKEDYKSNPAAIMIRGMVRICYQEYGIIPEASPALGVLARIFRRYGYAVDYAFGPYRHALPIKLAQELRRDGWEV